jgi:uncharacterized protein (TIGR00730 family)
MGFEIGRRGYILVYGGGAIGLMGAVARAAKGEGAEVIGVIPESMNVRGITYEEADQLVVTKDLRERKAVMEARSDALIALPGGFGTLEETLETLTLKQLHAHNKPVVIVNAFGFYQPLLNLFAQLYEQSFARPELSESYHIVSGAAEALNYIDSYQPKNAPDKWF